MNDEQNLRLKARQALEAGELPYSQPQQMWGGPGAGERCVLCRAPVQADEIGFELEFAAGPIKHIHLRCFSAWESERLIQRSDGFREPHALRFSDRPRPAAVLPSIGDGGRIYTHSEGIPASPCESDGQRNTE